MRGGENEYMDLRAIPSSSGGIQAEDFAESARYSRVESGSLVLESTAMGPWFRSSCSGWEAIHMSQTAASAWS